MISKSMAAALNNHMNIELYSANLYLSISSCANEMGLKGAATWFMVQYQEEMTHFMKFYNYLVSQGVNISILAGKRYPINTVRCWICLKRLWSTNSLSPVISTN